MSKEVWKVLLCLLLMLVLFPLSTQALVPHPLADYQIREYRSEDRVREKYSVTMSSEDVSHPWRDHSYVTLYSREVAETWALRQAHRMGLVGEEKEEFVEKELSLLDEKIILQLFLRSYEKDGHLFTHVVNFNPLVESFDPQIGRILLEFDDGRIVEAKERHPGGSIVSGGGWRAFNSVAFPAYDEEGEPLLTQETEWFYLWLVTDTYRIYFPFYFEG